MIPETTTVPDNINTSAYRVIRILKVLEQHRSLDGATLSRLLLEEPRVTRTYNPETLTKYINTLREAGCQIPRSTNRNDYRYTLLCNPFPLDLEPEEAAIAKKLRDFLAECADTELSQAYEDFLEELWWHAPFLQPAEIVPEPPLKKGTLPQQDLFTVYQAYCRAGFALEILYREATRETCLLLDPQMTLTRNDRLWLLGIEHQSQQSHLIDIQRIVSVRQLPVKCRRRAMPVTVVFALYGRLAGGYRLYPDEEILSCTKEELRIQVRTPDPSGLMNRLLRYGEACRLLSPESLRKAMGEHVKLLMASFPSAPQDDPDWKRTPDYEVLKQSPTSLIEKYI